MIVTSISDISKSSNNKKKLIYIDFEPAFALYNKELRAYNIKENENISKVCYDNIVEMLSKRATIRAMNLLKGKDYTKKELIGKLKQSYYPQKSIQAALEYVERYGYIDDERYAKNYISWKADKKSKKQIEQFLKEKGIDFDVMENAFKACYDESQEHEIDLIINILKKKYGNIPAEEFDYNQKQKMMAYIYRKGFDIDTIRKAIDVFLDNI